MGIEIEVIKVSSKDIMNFNEHQQFQVIEKSTESDQPSLELKNSRKLRQKNSYKCEMCEESFTAIKKLEMHVKSSCNYKPFKCDKCDKEYSTWDSLKNHQQVHSETFHECDVCNKKYKRRTDLNTHKRLHLNLEYTCDLCGNSYKRKMYLKKHIIFKNAIEKFTTKSLLLILPL